MQIILVFKRIVLFIYFAMSAFIAIFAWDLVDLGAYNVALSMVFQILVIMLQEKMDAIKAMEYHDVGRKR